MNGVLSYIPYPAWIRPEIIPGLPIRWYGLMYLVAFAVTYLLFMVQLKELSDVRPSRYYPYRRIYFRSRIPCYSIRVPISHNRSKSQLSLNLAPGI